MRRLRGLAKPLSTRGVDALEQRASRIVEREEVDEPDVLQHLGRAVPCERILVSENGEERRHGVGAHSAQRILRGGPHPPALLGEMARDGRSGLRPEHVAGGAGCMDADEPLAVVETREERDADVVAAPRSERLDGGGADVRIAVPGELDERRLAEVRIGPQQRRAPEANRRVPVAQQRDQLRAGRRGEPLEFGCDRGSADPSPRRSASRRRSIAHSSPMSPSVRIAAAAIFASSIDEQGTDQAAGPRDGAHARGAGSPSRGATVPTRFAAVHGPVAQAARRRASLSGASRDLAVIRARTADGRRRSRARAPPTRAARAPSTSEGDVENEFVHQLVVVARRSPAVPRTRDPRATGPRRHNLAATIATVSSGSASADADERT